MTWETYKQITCRLSEEISHFRLCFDKEIELFYIPWRKIYIFKILCSPRWIFRCYYKSLSALNFLKDHRGLYFINTTLGPWLVMAICGGTDEAMNLHGKPLEWNLWGMPHRSGSWLIFRANIIIGFFYKATFIALKALRSTLWHISVH